MSHKYEVGDRLGSYGALYLAKLPTIKRHNRGLFLCPICNKDTFEAEPSRVAHNKVYCCSECKRKKSRKYEEGDFVGKNQDIRIIKHLPNHRVLLKCPICGRENWDADLGTVSNLTMCYECYKQKRIKAFSNNHKYQIGDLVGPFEVKLLEYAPTHLFGKDVNRSYHWFECKKCGAPFLARMDHLESGRGSCYCHRCRAKSKGETVVQSILDDFNIAYISQFIFPDCVNIKTNYPLRFDFYLPEYNCCIEYDGEQHYKAIDMYGGEEGLQKNQYRDAIKNAYCKQHNIQLIRIRYDAPLKDIYNTLVKIGRD